MIEKTLIEQCLLGKRQAQKALYDQYSGQMYSICLRYCKDKATASDALQMGFVKVFQNLGSFRAESNLGGWIRRVVINEALGQLRKKKSRFTQDMEVVNDLDMSYEMDVNLDGFNYDRMIGLLDQLPIGYRTVFSMAVLDDMSHKEISASLNITENTSRSQLLRARRMMQDKIQNDNYLSHQYIDKLNNI